MCTCIISIYSLYREPFLCSEALRSGKNRSSCTMGTISLAILSIYSRTVIQHYSPYTSSSCVTLHIDLYSKIIVCPEYENNVVKCNMLVCLSGSFGNNKIRSTCVPLICHQTL